MTRDELIAESSENIAEHVDEVKADVLKDVKMELAESLRKVFKGNKNIRFE